MYGIDGAGCLSSYALGATKSSKCGSNISWKIEHHVKEVEPRRVKDQRQRPKEKRQEQDPAWSQGTIACFRLLALDKQTAARKSFVVHLGLVF